MTKMPPVTWLRAFDAAARNQSFARAAEELGLTPPAISQQIKALETHLNADLFVRKPRAVVLTHVGHAYAQSIQSAFAEMQRATDGLFSAPQRQVVHLRASISYAAYIIAPALPEFQRSHPNIEIRLSTTVWNDGHGGDMADLEIRYGNADAAGKRVSQLGARKASIVCHPNFAATLGPRPDFETLATHAVRISGSEMDWDLMAEGLDLARPVRANGFVVDSSINALQLVLSGTGAAIVDDAFSQHLVDTKSLVRPLDHKLRLHRSFYLVEVSERPPSAPVAQVRNWIIAVSGLKT